MMGLSDRMAESAARRADQSFLAATPRRSRLPRRLVHSLQKHRPSPVPGRLSSIHAGTTRHIGFRCNDLRRAIGIADENGQGDLFVVRLDRALAI